MKLFSFSRFFAKLGQRRTVRKSQRGGRRATRPLSLELLEDRTLMSIAPAPIVTNPNTSPYVNSTGFAPSSGFDPQVVRDPTNSHNLVEVNTTGTSLVGNYSTDGGQSWKGFTFTAPITSAGVVGDPTTFFPEVPYADVTSPSVSFDRNGNFYVVSNQFNAAALTQASSAADLANGTNVAGASGAIVFDKFAFNSGNPTEVAADSNQVLYQWYGQDPAYNPTVAVDSNLPATISSGPSFTDPVTGATQTDTLAVSINPTTGAVVADGTANDAPKGIYVGWNINFTEPQFSLVPAVSRIMIAASGDGGKLFTTNQYADTAGSGFLNNQGIGSGVGAAPQILFTQGTTAAANANTIALTGPPSVAAGAQSGSYTVQVKNGANGVDGVVVDLSSTSATGTFYSTSGAPLPTTAAGVPYVITSGPNGTASFLYEDTTPGTPTLTAADAAIASQLATLPVTVTAGFANTITFQGNPITAAAGQQAGPITIHVATAANGAIGGDVVNLTSSSGTGIFYTLSGATLPTTAGGVPYVVTDASGNAQFLYMDTTVGTPTLTASDATGVTGTQQEKIIADEAITFLTAPTSTPAGERSTPILLQVADEGTPVPNEVVYLSGLSGFGNYYNGATGAALPKTAGGVPFVVTDSNGQASVLVEDIFAGPFNLKATEAANASVTATQTETITAGVVKTISFTNAVTTANAGQESGPYTIQVNSSTGPVPGELVNLSSDSNANGVFYNSNGPGASVITSVLTDASGQATFFYVDFKQETPTLTATDAGDFISGSQKETVNAPVVTAINFVAPDAMTTTAGRQSGTITIKAVNGVAGVANEVVNLTTSSPATGVFYNVAGTSVITSVITGAGGTASFLYEDSTVGTPNLTATDAVSGGVASAPQTETVNASAVTAINFPNSAISVTAGKQSGPITFTVTGSSGPISGEVVNLASTSVNGIFYSTTTGAPITRVVTDGSGNAQFLYMDTTVGTPTLKATDAVAASPMSGQQQETVTAGVAIIFTSAAVSTPAGQQSNTATPITIQETNDNGTGVVKQVVYLSGTATGTFYNISGAPLPTTAGGVPYVVTDGTGHASFLYLDTIAGTPTLKATDSANPGLSGQQQETVSHGIAANVALTPPIQSTTAGKQSAAITVTVTDSTPNPVANELVTLSDGGAGGVFYNSAGPGASVITSVITGPGGTATFYYENPTPSAPTYTLTATATGNGVSVSGTQTQTITAGNAGTPVFSGANATEAGQVSGAITITVPNGAGEVVQLSVTGSTTGVFYNAPVGPGASIITSVIANGSGVATVYYEDPTPGTPMLVATVRGPLGAVSNAGYQVTVSAGAAINFVAPDATSVNAGQQSGPITVAVTDASSSPVGSEQVYLTSTSATGNFFSTTGAPLPTTAAGVAYVVTDSTTGKAQFLYEDSTPGMWTLKAAAAAVGSVSKTQVETVNNGVATGVSFPNIPISTTAGKQSTPIAIQVAGVTSPTVVTLGSSFGTGTFYNSSGTALLPKTTGGVPYVVTDSTGKASFVYLDTTPGTPTLTATTIGASAPVTGQQVETIQNGAATAIAFTSTAKTSDPGQEAGPITVQVKNGVNGLAGELVNLTTDSPTGTFFDANGNIITSVITDPTGHASFFYMDTAPGSPDLTASDAAKPAINVTQTETITTAGVALVRGGQMNIVYSTITGAAAKIQQSQPDGGLAVNLVAAAGVKTVNPNLGIEAALTNPSSPTPPSKYTPTPTKEMFTVATTDFDFNGGAAFGKINDMEATIDVEFPTMQSLSIVLTPPTGTLPGGASLAPITLLANGLDDNGNAIPFQGVTGANMGVLNSGQFGNDNNVGTVFDSDAPRNITDLTASAPWIGHFQPEFGSLTEFNGLTPSEVEGPWTLTITDFTNQGTSFQVLGFLKAVSLHFSSKVSTSGFGTGADSGTGDPAYTERGASQTVALPGALTGSPSNVYTAAGSALGSGASGTPGAGPGVVAAIDNTLGSFSPFQGRFYIGYTTGTNILLIHSDGDGVSNSWTNGGPRGNPVQVNDDSAADNFSEGNRPEFMPSLTIDPVTGTVVVDYYDARYDAATARVVTSVAYSVDGGEDFSASAPMNPMQTATDEITGNTVDISPIPGNTTAAGTFGFGDRQGLVAYDGSVIALFGSNLNVAGSQITTADVNVPSGPTVVSGDMGPVVNDFTYTPTVYKDSVNGSKTAYAPITYNNVFAADGTRLLDQFVVAFDRPIDISTFTPSQIQVMYEDTAGNKTPIAVQTVAALDNHTLFGPDQVGFFNAMYNLATQFLITLAAPQSKVGTYSYAIGLNTAVTPITQGALLSTDIRAVDFKGNLAAIHAGPASTATVSGISGTPILLGSYMNQNANALTNVTQVVNTYTQHTVVNGVPTTHVTYAGGVNTTTPVESTDTPVTIPSTGTAVPDTILITDPYQQVRQDYYDPIQLRVDIGTSSAVTLGVKLVSADGTTVDLGTATFTPDTAGVATIVFADYKPYTLRNADGTAVTVQLPASPKFAALVNEGVNGNWTLQLTNSSGGPVTLNDWSLSLPRTTNVFAVPNPTNGQPFNFPYSNQTLPLIVPGPHVVSTAVVSTGTDVVTNATPYTTTGVTQTNIALTLTAGATTTQGQLTLPITDAYQIQQNGANHIQVHLDLTNVTASENLQLQLKAQDGTTVTLYSGTITPDGSNNFSVTFDDFAAAPPTGPLASGSTVAPASPLSALINDNTAGDWQLVITNTGGATATLTVADWTLQLPHTTGDNEVLNGTANGVLITFDRDMNPNTFTSANVVQMINPLGTSIGGEPTPNPSNFTVTADPMGTPAALSKRVFEVTFPTQALNGTYSLSLAPSIQDTNGNAVDTNLNAGIDQLNGASTTNTVNAFINQTTNGNLNFALPASGQPVSYPIPIAQALQILQDNPAVSQTFTAAQQQHHHIEVQLDIGPAAGSAVNSSDFSVQLVAPDGTVVQLFSNLPQQGGVQGFASTIFDDFSTSPISQGTPPYSDQNGQKTFSPQNPLSVLVGKNTQGTWQLVITNNNANGQAGVLNKWGLQLPYSTPDTNLGESPGDQISVHFRIFSQDPTNPLTQQQWTAVGPAPDNNGANSGPVNAIAVDPSDPSGNTVYVGAATGGLWKTTNFLTTDPLGPTYIPLTNLGPTGSLNISSIAVFGQNGDPRQSFIYAMTGNPNMTAALPGNIGVPNDVTNGIGMIFSQDGGQTWSVIDSSHNFYDAANDGSGGVGNANIDDHPLPENLTSPVGGPTDVNRDHLFVGLLGYKVVVDPTRLPDNNIVVYAAFSSSASNPNGGLYRSIDSGADWLPVRPQVKDTITGQFDLFQGAATAVQAGNATDVVLAGGSGDNNNNLQQLYAAFQGKGVYGTSNATGATSLTVLAGGNGDNSRLNGNGNFPVPVTSPAETPSTSSGRIVLATPAATNKPLEDKFYENWVYALVQNDNKSNAPALYVSKDAGANWTQIRLPVINAGTTSIDGTNNFNRADVNTLNDPDGTNDQIQGVFNLTLTIDPTNPNVVYLGGAGYNLLRIDITNLSDPYAMVGYTNIAPDGGLVQTATTGPASLTVTTLPYGIYNVESNDLNNFPEQGPSGSTAFYNLVYDPKDPLGAPSTLHLTNVANFNNQGTGALVGEIGTLKNRAGVGLLGNVTNSLGVSVTPSSMDIRAIVAIRDPLTGDTRLMVGNDNGVFTGADQSVTAIQSNIGAAQVVTGSRNGNLQLADMAQSAGQPSSLAANIAGALFYGESQFNNGFPQSTATILDTGNLDWTGVNSNGSYKGNGTAIATDPTGSGQLYQYRWANTNAINNPANPLLVFTDFFLVTPPQTQITSRTGGAGGALNPADQTQWPSQGGSRFAVNPVDPTAIVMSSQTGAIYLTSGPGNQGGTGVTWHLIAAPGITAGSYSPALAFGAALPGQPANNSDNFIYAGTFTGHVFVTFTGGGASWKDLTTATLDGSPVEQIVTDPNLGRHDLYIVTQKGVYYMADSTAVAPTWTNITGGLFGLTRSIFDNPKDANDQYPTLKDLTSLAVDWRFAVPTNPANPSSPTFPVLYVGGDGGVFRSQNEGGTWTYFPDVATDGAVEEGGNLPNMAVTSLQLMTGNTNSQTGLPNESTGYNMLLASTYGQGDFVIRLDNSAVQKYAGPQIFFAGPQVASIAPVTANGGAQLTGVTVTFATNIPVDPQTVKPSDLTLYDPNGNVVAVQSVTDVTPTVNGVNAHNVFQFTLLTPQTTLGAYTVKVSGAADNSGDLMTPYTGTITFPYSTIAAAFDFPLPGVSVPGVSGGVFVFRPTTGFEQIGQMNASLLAVGGDGEVAAQFPSGISIYTDGIGWQPTSKGGATLLTMDGAGDAFAVISGDVWRYMSTTGWVQTHLGNASALAGYGAGFAYAVIAGDVYMFTPNVGWQQTHLGVASTLAADNAGAAFTVHNGDVWRFTPTTGWLETFFGAPSALAAGGGTAYAVISGDIWRFTTTTGWQQTHLGTPSALAADNAGDAYAELPGRGVWRLVPNVGWQQQTMGNVVNLPVMDAKGDLFGDVSGKGLYRYTIATGWQSLVTGDTTLFTVDNVGDVFAVFAGDVYRYTTATSWQPTHLGNATTLGADGAGDVLAIHAGDVWRFTSTTGWQPTNLGNASALTVNNAGVAFAVHVDANGNGDVWRFTPNVGWVETHLGNAASLAVDNSGDAFVVHANDVWRFTPTGGWQATSGGAATSLAADYAGNLLGDFPNVGAYRFTATTGWQPVATGASLVSEDTAGDVFVDFPNQGFFRYLNGIGLMPLEGTEGDASLLA